MTLDKALKIQENLIRDKSSNLIQDESDALKLTTEATKRFKALREVIRVPLTDPLPGEDPIINNSRSLHHIKETLENPEVR